MAREDWEILSRFKVGNKYYHKVTCKACGETYDKVRQDGLGKKVCCRKKDKAEIIPVGVKFNRLTNLGESHRDNGVVYNWLCDCGKTVKLRLPNIKQGYTKSCGCYKESIIGRPVEKHGMAETKEYRTWRGVIARTEAPYESTRKWYFDKNIRVSEEWRKSFLKFYEDMGDCPEGYTLDRIDPDGSYCKENCRWASNELQSINKGMYSSNTSGVKGVSLNKDSGKYVAYIYHKGVKYDLGAYSTLEEASGAREKAEKTVWKNITE